MAKSSSTANNFSTTTSTASSNATNSSGNSKTLPYTLLFVAFAIIAAAVVVGLSALYSVTAQQASAYKSTATVHAIRLRPRQDFFYELLAYVKRNKLRAVSLVSAVGSFTNATIRYANQPGCTALPDASSIASAASAGIKPTLEITSLVGTIDEAGGAHIHATLGDGTGKTFSGHLCFKGNYVYTTIELTLMELDQLVFTREIDPETTFDELAIKHRTL